MVTQIVTNVFNIFIGMDYLNIDLKDLIDISGVQYPVPT